MQGKYKGSIMNITSDVSQWTKSGKILDETRRSAVYDTTNAVYDDRLEEPGVAKNSVNQRCRQHANWTQPPRWLRASEADWVRPSRC